MTSRPDLIPVRCNESYEKLTIDTTLHPDVPFFVTGSAVTGVEESGVWLSDPKLLMAPHTASRDTNLHVDIKVTVIVPPDSPGD